VRFAGAASRAAVSKELAWRRSWLDSAAADTEGVPAGDAEPLTKSVTATASAATPPLIAGTAVRHDNRRGGLP
jgi:hypothetical protein